MNLRWCLTLFLLVSYFPKAHAAVQYYPERKVWVLQAGEATYAMGVNERGELQAIYWGPRVMRDADFSPCAEPRESSLVRSIDHHHAAGVSGLGRGTLQRAGPESDLC